MTPEMVIRGHRFKIFKKTKAALGQKFFIARLVDLWNGFDGSKPSVSMDTIIAFKRKL